MKKALILAILFAFIIAIIPAEASSPLEVTIFSPMIPNGTDGEISGYFKASGPAVEAGIFCTDGTVTNMYHKHWSDQSGQHLNVSVYKKLDCTAGGSGTIYLNIQVLFDLTTGQQKAEWVIKKGTGDYTRLKGEGKMTHTDITYPDPIIWNDLYTGKMH
jgi:hypothetical protein